MTASEPTESERRQAEAAFKLACPKVLELAKLEEERDWGTPLYSAVALRDVFVAAYLAGIRASCPSPTDLDGAGGVVGSEPGPSDR